MADDANHRSMLGWLPEVFRAPKDDDLQAGRDHDQALADFLRAFERLLLGGDDDLGALLGSNPRGLEDQVADLPRLFTPGTSAADGAPDEFLPWLSGWLALSLRTDITQDPAKDNLIRRRFIARMAQLYPYRGTKRSLAELLAIFTGRDVLIRDQFDDRPHYFEVQVNLEAIKTSADQAAFERAKELAHSVIQLDKPAHTRYLLIPALQTMRIGQRGAPPPPPPGVTLPTDYAIEVGVNTRLGATPKS